jgi:hypothetical protein
MARQKGIIHLSGTLQDLNFYYRKGVAVVRAAGGGFDGKAIRTKPEMARVRENASEFGRVSSAKKLVREGLQPFLKELHDLTLHGRLMRLFQQIKVLDIVSERGQRCFENGLATAEGKRLFLAFDWSPKRCSLLLPGHGVFDAATYSYHINEASAAQIVLPAAATGMQVSFGLLEIDFTEATFVFHQSAALCLDSGFSAAAFALTPDTLPSTTGVCLAFLQLRYYQDLNGARYFLKEGLGLEAVGVV